MELAPNEKRMTRNLDHLDISAVRSRARNAQPGGHHWFLILAIELVTMPVPLADLGLAVHLMSQRSHLDFPCPSPHPHRPPHLLPPPHLPTLLHYPPPMP